MASEFSIGDRVRLMTQPPYLKTADPMPMLRPADTLELGAEGIVIDRRPGGYWGIKFDRGSFLLDSQHLEKIPQTPPSDTGRADDIHDNSAIEVKE